MIGAILMKTFPAMTITSASLGEPRTASDPNHAVSYWLVRLRGHLHIAPERPELNGHLEFLRPQAIKSCSRGRTTQTPNRVVHRPGIPRSHTVIG